METSAQIRNGRKVFFLNPSAAVVEQLVLPLARDEIEAYSVDLPVHALRFFEGYADPLLFVTLPVPASREKGGEPPSFLEALSRASFRWGGIVEGEPAGNGFPPADRIPLGTYRMGGKPQEALQDLRALLESLSVRGQRHYVRFGSQGAEIATMTATYRGEEYRGIVHDISSAGISCTIGSEAGGAELPINGILNPLHISCADWGIVVPGRIGIKRSLGGQTVYVVMFDQGNARSRSSEIGVFVHRSLQAQLSEKVCAYLRYCNG